MRFAVLVLILVVLAGCATTPAAKLDPETTPPLVTVTPFADSRHFMLERDTVFRIAGSDQTIVVPAGFVTDFASIPRAFWSGMSPHGQYSRAAVLHDYLYWTQSCTRAQADKLFLLMMKQSGVSPANRATIYGTVRTTGDGGWQRNAADRNAGFVRVIPDGYRELPSTAAWPAYRRQLHDAGLRPPPVEVGASYCELGDPAE
ncbi:MAG: DUF1353 domain-containing protein [Alphaproteobacteria bacterium]|nr:DUF1353 domain-containing protein [Alphaproteobacteria bacterium]